MMRTNEGELPVAGTAPVLVLLVSSLLAGLRVAAANPEALGPEAYGEAGSGQEHHGKARPAVDSRCRREKTSA